MAHEPAHAASVLELPSPALSSHASLADALRHRHTVRAFSRRALSKQALSNLLWAAFGVNRASGPWDAPGRTAGSASNSQEIDLYVCLASGAWRYDAAAHRLVLVAREDLRPLALGQSQSRRHIDPGAQAAVRLVYVLDVDRFLHTPGFDEPGLHDPVVQQAYCHVDTGLIAGNVYLYAAANGLAAWFHSCDRWALHRRLALRSSQQVLFAQTVGYEAHARARSRQHPRPERTNKR